MARRMPGNLLWMVITLATTGAWAVNTVLPWVSASYRPDPSINNIFMAVVGGVVALQVERAESRHRHDQTQGQGDQSDE